MISYAQNFEDVILARVFSGQVNGFYIDVGVCDPDIDSVTKHFYDAGWSGINVEPLYENSERISKARPRDINICGAAGRELGALKFYEVIGTGLSTSDVAHANRHEKLGYTVKPVEVPMSTLASICEQHVGNRVIDFLKVDVEGAEGDVVAGADWRRWRPRVVLLEATLPNSRELAPLDWDPSLIENGYDFVYFDGLNRWYVREEEPALRDSFSAPPNIFDNFVLYRDLQRTQELKAQISALEQRLNSAMIKSDRWDALGRSFLGKVVTRL